MSAIGGEPSTPDEGTYLYARRYFCDNTPERFRSALRTSLQRAPVIDHG
jgi:hypothetical protein